MKSFILFLSAIALLKAGYAAVLNDCECGTESNEGSLISGHRIVNGTEARPHRYPWMTVQMYQDQNICGGSIISDKNILTAGHCLFYVPNPLATYWIVGTHSVLESMNFIGNSYRTASYKLHPRFNNGNMFDTFDMGIVITDRPIKFSPTVKPICLPEPNEDLRFLNKKLTTAGWGKMSEDGTVASDVLLETQVFLRSANECRKLTKPIKFDDKAMICAHEHHTDACQGDSGGPIFGERSPNQNIILGVVSFGDGCARDFPGIYSRVTEPNTLSWIQEMISTTRSNVCTTPTKKFFSFFF